MKSKQIKTFDVNQSKVRVDNYLSLKIEHISRTKIKKLILEGNILVDENGIIIETKFKTFGCGSAIASSSLATEWIKGKHINEARLISNKDISNYLKLPPVKLHCSMLAQDAIHSAIDDFLNKTKNL